MNRQRTWLADPGPLALTLLLAAALAFSLLNFLTIAAVLPELIGEWNLSKTQAGWLVGVYFAGYMFAILYVASLTDRIDPRKIYLIGALCGGLSSLALALFANGFWLTMILRFMGGIAFSGIYMPGLRALTDRLEPQHRNRGIVYYTSCFALGSGFSIIAAGRIAAVLDWRWAFAVAAMGSFAAMTIAAIVLRPAQRDAAAPRVATSVLSTFAKVWRNRRAVAYILAMYGVGWEVFGFRSWIVTYLAERQASETAMTFWLTPSDIAFATALGGIPASIWIGTMAARVHRELLLLATACVSFALAILLSASVAWRYDIILALCFVFSMTSFGRSAATTAGMMNAAQDEVRGATMAAHSFVAFLSGISSPLVIGLFLDLSGWITGTLSWTVGLSAIGIGSCISMAGYIWAMRSCPVR